MNKDKKIVIIASISLVMLLFATVTTIVVFSSTKEKTVAKRAVDIELEKEQAKINKSENIYYNYKEKAPVSEKIVEESAMQDLDQEKTESKKENVVTEVIKREFSCVQPLAKNTYEIVDTFAEKYEGFNQTYIETIIFKINFKSGNPGIIYKAKKDNTKVYAIEAGTVIAVGDNTARKAGYDIIIEHENGVKSEYYCLKEVKIKKGDKVKRGQNIAIVGDIDSTLLKNELRVYILENDKIVNPSKYIK